jgi:hypothetical protein
MHDRFEMRTVGKVLLCMLLVTGASIYFFYDCSRELKQVLATKEAQVSKFRKGMTMDLQSHFPDRISQLCIQGPYGGIEKFLDAESAKHSSIPSLGDGEFILWVFFQDKTKKPCLVSLPMFSVDLPKPPCKTGSVISIVPYGTASSRYTL